MKAKRVLTMREIQTVLSVKPHTVSLDADDMPKELAINDICAGLVVVDDKSKIVRLAHFTMAEFLRENILTDIKSIRTPDFRP
jgi:hypothetical protein